MNIKIITGMAGGGKSTALDAFEDMGYYCIDNLPPTLLDEFLSLFQRTNPDPKPIALVMDLRLGVFFDELLTKVDELRKQDYDVQIIFVEASKEVILNRYREARRAHPQEKEGRTLEAIERETEALAKVRDASDIIINTTRLNVHQLKQKILRLEGDIVSRKFQIIITSFGFKYGTLHEADYLFDLRFLPNPYYVPELSDKTGHDEEVREYIFKDSVSREMFERMKDLLDLCAEQFRATGRDNMIIGLGCTGGHHRSVTFGFLLEEHFKSLGYTVIRSDRELEL
ncbi:MAG: RNase adapter RapZ [Tissierellia bacterium]|mgnify:CR=1 FL=1|jgi:UPF0042 nucleotide-binding protein|nr:RNase adapter RapZ [Bacillota bacterium]NLL22949.1 RNase adapter RapZ [Tissierellia bacterium]